MEQIIEDALRNFPGINSSSSDGEQSQQQQQEPDIERE